MSITLQEFSILNRTRSKAIEAKSKTTFDLLYFGVGISGEVGELCNYIKKQYRDEVDNKEEQMREIADIFSYLDLLAEKVGCTIEECLRLKWDDVSKKHGLSHRLPID